MTSRDYVANTYLPYLLYNHGSLDFKPIVDEITKYISGSSYYVLDINDGYYSKYPILTGLMAYPIYYIPLALNKIPNIDTLLNNYKVLALGRVAASFYASTSVAIFYLILKKLRAPDTKETTVLLFVLFYALGTNTWSISSRGLWTHTSSQFLLSLAFLALLKSLSNHKYVLVTSLFLGLSVLARPTNIIPTLILSIYVLKNFSRHIFKYVLCALPTIIIYFLFNKIQYGNYLIEGYQLGDKLIFNSPLYISIPGLLFSPGKGYLFSMPMLLMGIYGAVIYLFTQSRDKLSSLFFYISLTVLCAFLFMAMWRGWEGADRFGPGLLTEYLPFITSLSFLSVQKLFQLGRAYVYKVLIIFLILYSILMQFNVVIFRKSRCAAEHTWSFYCLLPPKEMPDY